MVNLRVSARKPIVHICAILSIKQEIKKLKFDDVLLTEQN